MTHTPRPSVSPPFTPRIRFGISHLYGLVLATLGVLAGCGDDTAPPAAGDAGPPDARPLEHSLDDFLPPLPTPTGAAPSVFAGLITPDNAAAEVPTGPGSGGLPGDFYVKNARGRYVIQAAARVVGINPYGGTVVDAIALDADGEQIAPEHFGELGVMYLAGRTCNVSSVEVLLDGSGGGPAVIRARGRGDVNTAINLAGLGLLPVPRAIDPNIEDQVDCAITYTLDPDAAGLKVAHTLYNGGLDLRGPFGLFSDVGGQAATWAPTLGYHSVNLSSIATLTTPTPAPYEVLQAPGVATGLIPRPDDTSKPSAPTSILGISIILFHTDSLLSILGEDGWALELVRDDGVTFNAELVVGADANDVEVAYQAGHPTPTVLTAVTGDVLWEVSGAGAVGARVGFFHDADDDGALDPEDPVVTFTDVAIDGRWEASLAPGTYLVTASVEDVGRSPVVVVTVGAAAVPLATLRIPEPARYDYEVRDADTGELIPARLAVVGVSPAPLDGRLHLETDRRVGVVKMVHAPHGTTVAASPTDPVDPVLSVPAGGPYRVFVSHGPEWTYASELIEPTAAATGTLTFTLRHAVDTTGYLATEFHQHSIGSPDSQVSYEDRLASLVTEGIEYFASSDHDYLSDYAPVIDALGLRGVVDSTVGVESTPFVWGHFIAWPLDIDASSPARGAPDWGAGPLGRDLLPVDLIAAERAIGAQIVQVNHPRATGFGFQAYFDVVQLTFDFVGRTFHGDPGSMPVEARVLRQPEDLDLFTDSFDALEVWTNFSLEDTNEDGWLELAQQDLVLRDWFNFIAFGRMIAPVGNSDTHTLEKDPAGLPRTLIRVPDDSRAALLAGLGPDLVATLQGTTRPQDLIVTNGPMIAVSTDGGATSAIGRVVAPATAGGAVTFTVTAQVPAWMALDTIEVFANPTFDPLVEGITALQPLGCFTTRTGRTPTDACELASLGGGARPLTVTVLGPEERRVATATFTLRASDLETRSGAVGQDAVVVVRASGQSALFPLLYEGHVTAADVPALVLAETPDEVNAVFASHARFAFPSAFTAPIRVDFDGGGFRAPFAP